MFEAPEFKWLRARVAETLWSPPASRVMPATWDPARALQMPIVRITPVDHSSVVDLGFGTSIDGFSSYRDFRAAADREDHRQVVLARARRQDASVLKDREQEVAHARGLTVEEYNRGRSSGQPYVHQEYPKVLYKDGGEVIVENARDHKRHHRAGWREAPE